MSFRTAVFRALLALCIVGLTPVADRPAAAAQPAEAEQGGGDINPFSLQSIKADLAIWTAVVFLVLLAVLWKLAWRPIADGLDKREQSVADQIAQAEAANQKAKDLLAEYDRKLATAAEQARAVLDQGRRDAEQAGRELIDKAKEEAKAEYQRAAKQIESAAAAALTELADRSATLAVDLAGKIVHATLDPRDHAQLIEQAVAGFVQSKGDVGQN